MIRLLDTSKLLDYGRLFLRLQLSAEIKELFWSPKVNITDGRRTDEGWRARRTGGQTVGQTGGRTDGQTDGRMNRRKNERV